jgi:hypothetical protein
MSNNKENRLQLLKFDEATADLLKIKPPKSGKRQAEETQEACTRKST